MRVSLWLLFVLLVLAGPGQCAGPTAPPPPNKVAAIIADWYANSHPEVIVGRIIKGYRLDGTGEFPNLTLASVYRDRPTEKDVTPALAERYHFIIAPSVEAALTLGTGALAVDGVILCTEHGVYPLAPNGQMQFAHRRLFAEIAAVFRRCGRVVPVFIDKHIADNREDTHWIVDTAKAMKIPLMAGSSVPMSWRHPATDVAKNARLRQIVGLSYGGLDAYSFHGLEMVQALAERRRGGETGVKSVRCLEGKSVWEAAGRDYDPALLDAALARLEIDYRRGRTLQKAVPDPVLYVIDYRDGLRVNLFTLNGAVGEWSAAWRYRSGKIDSTLCWVQDASPFSHFTNQLKGIEAMFVSGKPAWPVERTLLTSGILTAALDSKLQGGAVIDTPDLRIRYRAAWHWTQPPDPAPTAP